MAKPMRRAKGHAAVSLGTYQRVSRVLGLDADLDLLARDDVLGRKLQDLALEPRRLLLPGANPPHVGTLDVDLDLDPERLAEGVCSTRRGACARGL